MGLRLSSRTLKKLNSVYNYSALNVTNVIMNYVIFKTGDDWEKLLHKVFNEHVKVKDNVYFSSSGNAAYALQGSQEDILFMQLDMII